MGENSSIEWTDHTWNPWEGCQKVGPGCDHCYAETRNARFNGGTAVNWGPGAPRRRTSAANWKLPRRWEREAIASGIRPRVFCASLADVFDNAVDPQWRADLFELIAATPNLDWLLLTKRIGNVEALLPPAWFPMPRNVRAGATMVNQTEVDRDWEKLAWSHLQIFVSVEPMLGPIVFPRAFLQMRPWIILGGESGPGARPMHPDWARAARDQCAEFGAPFLFKQWGDLAPVYDRDVDDPDWRNCDKVACATPRGEWLNLAGGTGFHGDRVIRMDRVGKKAAGRLLDGRTHDGFPSPIIERIAA